uniref:Uncharacterized protein n=1 Tax=viral metagenome TaxID=1070528 RepID=A0A6C0KD86_9ZZZZ
MNEYREQARIRYEKQVEDQHLLKQKIEKDEKDNERIHSDIYTAFDTWDHTLAEIESDTLTSLTLLLSILTPSFIDTLMATERLDELQQRVVALVERLNDVQNLVDRPYQDIQHINQIHLLMKTIIATSSVDIPIEVMDTEQDEEISKNLEEELLREDIQNIQDIQDIPNVPEFHDLPVVNLPIVSLTSNRVGLRLPELRDIARANRIRHAALSKRELALRLADSNLVQIL